MWKYHSKHEQIIKRKKKIEEEKSNKRKEKSGVSLDALLLRVGRKCDVGFSAPMNFRPLPTDCTRVPTHSLLGVIWPQKSSIFAHVLRRKREEAVSIREAHSTADAEGNRTPTESTTFSPYISMEQINAWSLLQVKYGDGNPQYTSPSQHRPRNLDENEQANFYVAVISWLAVGATAVVKGVFLSRRRDLRRKPRVIRDCSDWSQDHDCDCKCRTATVVRCVCAFASIFLWSTKDVLAFTDRETLNRLEMLQNLQNVAFCRLTSFQAVLLAWPWEIWKTASLSVSSFSNRQAQEGNTCLRTCVLGVNSIESLLQPVITVM